MALTKAQAYRFVLVGMAQWARNAVENPDEDMSGEFLEWLLRSFTEEITLADAVLIANQAMSVATAAHILIAQLNDTDPVVFLESLVLEDALDPPFGPV